MKNKIANVCFIAGAALVLGAAGDSDIGNLTLEGAILKLIAGIIIFGAGVLLNKYPIARRR